jgi:hypothetical protein
MICAAGCAKFCTRCALVDHHLPPDYRCRRSICDLARDIAADVLCAVAATCTCIDVRNQLHQRF